MAITPQQIQDIIKIAGEGAKSYQAGKRADDLLQSTAGMNLADIIRGGITDQFNYAGRVDPNFNPLGENYYGPLRAGFGADIVAGKAGNKLTADAIRKAGPTGIPDIGFNYGDFLGTYTQAPYRASATTDALKNQLVRTGGLQKMPTLSEMYPGSYAPIMQNELSDLQKAILADREAKQLKAESKLEGLMKQNQGGFWNSGFGKFLKGLGGGLLSVFGGGGGTSLLNAILGGGSNTNNPPDQWRADMLTGTGGGPDQGPNWDNWGWGYDDQFYANGLNIPDAPPKRVLTPGVSTNETYRYPWDNIYIPPFNW